MVVGACVVHLEDQKPQLYQVSDVTLGGDNQEFLAYAEVQARNFLRVAGGDLDEHAVAEIVGMMVETGGASIIEVFSPARFTARAGGLGLRPGFAVDLCEAKPYGPNEGEAWDLSQPKDVRELKEMIAFEQPVLVTGSPPCTAFCLLQNLRPKEPNKRKTELEEATRLLHVAVDVYRGQLRAGRYFLHEHPCGCSSWDDGRVQALQREPGVFTVTSPMCCFNAKLPKATGADQEARIYKRTKWVTNSRVLAEALDRRCTNEVGGHKWHRHVSLLNGMAKFAGAYRACGHSSA